VKRHKSPLNFLLASHNLDVTNVERRPTYHRNPSRPGKSPFIISIARDRESSIEEDKNAREEVRVYSDGSAINGKVGAAAILTRAGNPPRILHMHLGTEEKHTVHEAELAGVLLALQLISSEQRGNTSFSLGLDNQAAIKALQSDHKGPGHHIAKEIDTLAHKISKRRQKATYSLTVRWTAGHEGITGNELADQEAKKAAEGLTSEKRLLPVFLRKPLTINPAAVKRADHEIRKNLWATKWKASERGQKTMRIDKSTPSKKFLKAISTAELSRETASRIAQFRLSHAPLNKFLKRIQKVDSARCPACGADEETIEHFLLTCPSYAHERWALTQAARKEKKALNLGTLLGDHEMILPLASYIEATHRFSKPGEQNNPQT
jgi:ribonuclease HI